MSSAGVKFADNDFGRAVLNGENPFEVTDRAWMGLYMPHDEFATFLAEDQARVAAILKDVGLTQ